MKLTTIFFICFLLMTLTGCQQKKECNLTPEQIEASVRNGMNASFEDQRIAKQKQAEEHERQLQKEIKALEDEANLISTEEIEKKMKEMQALREAEENN